MGKAPLRRNQLQQEQRVRTRHLILQASIQVFCERGYVNTSIEHVLKAANVSRAAFYSHFDGKLAVVSAIAETFAPNWHPTFTYLAELKDPKFEDIQIWAHRFLAHHKDNYDICRLLTQVTALEQDMFLYTSRQRDMLIAMLGEQHEAFAAAKRSDAIALEAHILLASLEQACFFAAGNNFPHQDDVVINIMAAKMLYFLWRRGRPLSPQPQLGEALR